MTGDRGHNRAAADGRPAEPLPTGYVDEALELLKRLNRLRFRDGSALSAAATIGGFETWWFIQHDLLWSNLIPYCQHRAEFARLLAGAPVAVGELPAEILRVSSRLGLPLNATQDAPAPGIGTLKRALGRLSQLGLVIFSLTSLLALRLVRRDTMLYILDHVSPGLDHDFRLSPVYAEARRRGYRVAEYLHARGFAEQYRKTWRNVWRRRRPAVLFGMLTWLAAKLRRAQAPLPRPPSEIDFDTADPDRQFLAAAAAWALTRAQQVVFETAVLGRLLRFQGVRRAVIVDHSSVIGQLIAACRLAEIPTLGYMHGNFTRFHAGLMAYGFGGARRHTFDLYGVWSDHYRARLLSGDLYDERNTFTSGPLRAPSAEVLQSAAGAPRQAERSVRALLISEKYAPQEEVNAYVRALSADPGIHLKLKLRLGEEAPRPSPAEPGGGLPALEVVRTASVYEALAQCDVVLGTHSTVLYEAVLALRPVVVLNTTFTYGHDLAREGLAEFSESPESVRKTVLRAHSLPQAELARRKNTLWGEELTDGARRLFDVAESRLWPRHPNAGRSATGDSC